MKRRFVVAIDDETSLDVSAFLEYIREQNFGWWHWVSNFWLLTTYDSSISVNGIRDKVSEICNRKWIVVLEVSPITWANFGPQGGEEKGARDISQWFRDNWN